MKKIITLLLMTLLISCSKPLDIQLEPEVHMFLSNEAENKILLTQEDEIYITLNKWLNENKSGWYATSGRYPGGVYIKSGKYGIQVIKSQVVIYSTTSSKPKAIYIQDIKQGELRKIINLGK